MKSLLQKIVHILHEALTKMQCFMHGLKEKMEHQPATTPSRLQLKNYINFHTILIGFAFLGILGLFHLVYLTSQKPPKGLPVAQPATSIYKNFIAASGIIEAAANNIQLSPIVGGVITQTHVNVGDTIQVGTPLFKQDCQQTNSDWELKTAQVALAQAALKQAGIQMQGSKKKFELVSNVKDKRAISRDDYITRENAFLIDTAAYETAQENLKVAVAQENVSKTNVDVLTTLSPIDGRVLQINTLVGEYAAAASPSSPPAMLLGKVDAMQIRIDIDENEAWRFKEGSKAVAYIRGNNTIKMDLSFDYVEPYVVPKTSLTGDTTERVDTRVLQVIYQFNPSDLPLFIGQQVDVYIEDLHEAHKGEAS